MATASEVGGDVDVDAGGGGVEGDAQTVAGRDEPPEQARIGAGGGPQADPAAELLEAHSRIVADGECPRASSVALTPLHPVAGGNLDLAVERVTGTHAGR